MNYIVIYADEYDTDVWEGYCCAAGVPLSATSITIKFNESDVEYTCDDDGEGDEEEDEDDD